MDGSVTSTGWGGEDKSGLVNEIVAPGRCKAKGNAREGNAMQCNAMQCNAKPKAMQCKCPRESAREGVKMCTLPCPC